MGVVQLFDRPRSLLGPAIVMGVGVVLLLFTLDVVTGSVLAVLWPALLIVVGAAILLRRGGGPRPAEGSPEDVIRATAVFGGHDVTSRSDGFRGGSATAVFGGVEIDLRGARLDPEGARIDATALFGGVEILVPKGWRVETSGTPIFGGIENRAVGESAEGPVLRVDALSIFGGTEIKHEK